MVRLRQWHAVQKLFTNIHGVVATTDASGCDRGHDKPAKKAVTL